MFNPKKSLANFRQNLRFQLHMFFKNFKTLETSLEVVSYRTFFL